jgi:hypothetical protein
LTLALAADGSLLRQLVSTDNTSSKVWTNKAYRSKRKKKWQSYRMLTSRIHRRKPRPKQPRRLTLQNL